MKNYFRILICSLMFNVLCIAFAVAGPVPDTGQTTSYTDTFGEDSDYNINTPSYTKLDANGNDLPYSRENWVMVRDNVTGLIWEVKTDDGSVHDKDNTYTWYDSNLETNGGNAGTPGDGTDTEDFINALNSSNFGGFSDWRLPGPKELKSIVNSNGYNPSIYQTYFPNTASSCYWVSTTLAYLITDAWSVNFSNGYVLGNNKADHYCVRAVRGEQFTNTEFINNGDGTITDSSTGLMWQQENPGTMAVEEALSYCESLSLAGYSDWRLPNNKELQSIIDYNKYNPCIDSFVFPGTVSSHYWSSTSIIFGITACNVDFNYGDVSIDFPFSSSNYVRAVRGGQSKPLSKLIISYPIGSEVLFKGQEHTITWNSENIEGDIEINLYKGGIDLEHLLLKLTTATENDGEFSFILPNSIEDGDDYYVGIIGNRGIISDFSKPFFIRTVGYYKIPDTGQTKCYNNSTEIPCPSEGEVFYGQDAQYITNPQSYTKLDANGNDLPDDAISWMMVRDNVTGLIWEIKTDDGSIHDKDNTYTWQNAMTYFIGPLMDGGYCGYHDWRIPSPKELKYIINNEYHTPSVDKTFFPNTVSAGYYWSVTPDVSDSNRAWYAYFKDGDVSSTFKTDNNYVRAVRGGIPTSGSFIDNGDGTVTDLHTGLMWQQGNPGSMTWEAALSYCEELTLANYDDWRLPNDKELQSIVDYDRYDISIDTVAFPGTQSSYYWSSTTLSNYPSSAWLVLFLWGNVDYGYKTNNCYVRAVRGGIAIIDVDNDELPDDWEQLIINADPEDNITTYLDVLPDNDFDNDGDSNLMEYQNGTDPVDPLSTTKGDLDGDKYLTIADAIAGLQVVCGMEIGNGAVLDSGDINGDRKIGIEEVVHIIKEISKE